MGNECLINFDRRSSCYDEWIPRNSKRLCLRNNRQWTPRYLVRPARADDPALKELGTPIVSTQTEVNSSTTVEWRHDNGTWVAGKVVASYMTLNWLSSTEKDINRLCVRVQLSFSTHTHVWVSDNDRFRIVAPAPVKSAPSAPPAVEDDGLSTDGGVGGGVGARGGADPAAALKPLVKPAEASIAAIMKAAAPVPSKPAVADVKGMTAAATPGAPSMVFGDAGAHPDTCNGCGFSLPCDVCGKKKSAEKAKVPVVTVPAPIAAGAAAANAPHTASHNGDAKDDAKDAKESLSPSSAPPTAQAAPFADIIVPREALRAFAMAVWDCCREDSIMGGKVVDLIDLLPQFAELFRLAKVGAPPAEAALQWALEDMEKSTEWLEETVDSEHRLVFFTAWFLWKRIIRPTLRAYVEEASADGLFAAARVWWSVVKSCVKEKDRGELVTSHSVFHQMTLLTQLHEFFMREDPRNRVMKAKPPSSIDVKCVQPLMKELLTCEFPMDVIIEGFQTWDCEKQDSRLGAIRFLFCDPPAPPAPRADSSAVAPAADPAAPTDAVKDGPTLTNVLARENHLARFAPDLSTPDQCAAFDADVKACLAQAHAINEAAAPAAVAPDHTADAAFLEASKIFLDAVRAE